MKYIILFLLFTLNLTAQEKLEVDPTTNCELRYLYFSNMQVYYDLKTKMYLYKVNGQVVKSNIKPKIGYSLFNDYFIQITDYDGDDILSLLERHKILYPYISSKKRNRK